MAREVSRQRLTKRVIDQAEHGSGRYCLWDSELRGFGICIEAAGTKTYFVRYRPKGLGRDGPRRYFKLGRHGDLAPDQARENAKSILGQVASGADPAQERRIQRQSHVTRRDTLSFEALVEMFLREHVAIKRKPKTHAQYDSLLRRHATPTLGRLKVEDLTVATVAKLHLQLVETPYLANRLIAVMSSVFGFAEAWPHIRRL